MKLTPEQLRNAVSLAINDHIPLALTRVGALSDWKGFAAAEAGRNAVFAARLARAGLTGAGADIRRDVRALPAGDRASDR